MVFEVLTSELRKIPTAYAWSYATLSETFEHASRLSREYVATVMLECISRETRYLWLTMRGLSSTKLFLWKQKSKSQSSCRRSRNLNHKSIVPLNIWTNRQTTEQLAMMISRTTLTESNQQRKSRTCRPTWTITRTTFLQKSWFRIKTTIQKILNSNRLKKS